MRTQRTDTSQLTFFYLFTINHRTYLLHIGGIQFLFLGIILAKRAWRKQVSFVVSRNFINALRTDCFAVSGWNSRWQQYCWPCLGRYLTVETLIRFRYDVWGFVVGSVAVGQVLFLTPRFPPVSIIPPAIAAVQAYKYTSHWKIRVHCLIIPSFLSIYLKAAHETRDLLAGVSEWCCLLCIFRKVTHVEEFVK